MSSIPGKSNVNRWILLVLIVQLIALTSIAAKRELIRTNGDIVFLRTAPVDPRDLFRGDFVRLQYEIATPQKELVSDELLAQQHETVYLRLKPDAQGVAQLTGITQDEPEGLFIKGSMDMNWRRTWSGRGLIKLGIEKYFIEQGSGLAMEKKRGRAQEWQTPMEMEVALGGDGTAVIRNHRWSDMGVRLEVLEAAENINRNRQNSVDEAAEKAEQAKVPRLSAKLRISLRNQSDHVLSLLDTANHCAFNLLENLTNSSGISQTYGKTEFAGRHCDEQSNWQVHTLAPQEVYEVDIDLAEPDWFVRRDNREVEVGTLPNRWTGFRWLYQVPATVASEYASQENVWTSPLRTARFIAGGRID